MAEAPHPPAGHRGPEPRRPRPPPRRAAVRAAAAAGADGIIVEVHEDPEVALCDGPQALEAAHFADYARDVAADSELLGKRLA